MVQLARWQIAVLVMPFVGIVGFLLAAAGSQIHSWGVNWVWGVVVVMLVLWQWLLSRWTRPVFGEAEAVLEDLQSEFEADLEAVTEETLAAAEGESLETSLQNLIAEARSDAPIWADWGAFWQRCQAVVTLVAHAHHPEVKYPLLNIYVTQAYGLIRGTVDDTDRAMQKLAPVLDKVSVGQAYRAYEVYRQLEPSMKQAFKFWNWAQWVLNPAAATARTLSRRTSDRANEQLLGNLSQLLRETALRNLAKQAAVLYGGKELPLAFVPDEAPLPQTKTATIRDILDRAKPQAQVEQRPVSVLLVGRTGAGKSSVINTLFRTDRAEVDVLPSTDKIRQYRWSMGADGAQEALILIDSPGYEQVDRADFRDQVLDYACNADLLLLVTPALDPALQMDADFLSEVAKILETLPRIAVVTQVDRLRPVREWNPPYDWQRGDRPKEKSIRDATAYRAERLACDRTLPLVTQDLAAGRAAWNADELSLVLLDAIAPSQQARLARYLRSQSARATAAAKIIDRYAFQMTSTEGVAKLLKSPILRYLSTLMTGSDLLAAALMEKIPVEQGPVVIGKLQMAYDLFNLLAEDHDSLSFDLLALWPLLLETPAAPQKTAWALGHGLIEYWTRDLSIAQLQESVAGYLEKAPG